MFYMFRAAFHPSSGVHNTLCTVSVINEVSTANYRSLQLAAHDDG